MTVYIVNRCVSYEGDYLVAVFDTKEKAEEYAKVENTKSKLSDWFEVEEWDVS